MKKDTLTFDLESLITFESKWRCIKNKNKKKRSCIYATGTELQGDAKTTWKCFFQVSFTGAGMGGNKSNFKKAFSRRKDVFRPQQPFIWQRDCHSWDAHTSVCSLAQQPCAMFSEINNRLFHHRLRFTAQSITSVAATCAACINHSAYSVKVSRRLLLIK